MWIKSDNARRWIYGIAAALVPLLTAIGVLTAEHGGLWLSLVAAILGTGAPVLAGVNTPRGRHAAE
ncbi:hypothetical protein [Lysinibacter sp. HNR]|uniref:hypothetical protein n=1 Tax=Lysinibacter sp. HNR TaxID=3031408 RepID=UPI002435211F|nr:hypothetical protein [Lysinibacter sp. HNR]WGD38464.1 hypothetical protein FrondiHNR_06025 [Lysinibacter sp. HNR]